MAVKSKPSDVSLWERIERPAPAPRSSLTAHQIAATAIAIADAEGLDAVTMRRLATDLGVAPMAAYRYVSGKDELLELMVDAAYAELSLDEVAGEAVTWREVLWALAVGTRALVLAHPWLVQLSSPQAVLAMTPNRFAVMEAALSALDGLGLDADAMTAAVSIVNAYVQGMAQADAAHQQLMEGQGWASGAEIRAGLAPRMKWLMGTGRYPTYRRTLVEGIRKDDPQWRFETGLHCVLDGIAARMGI